MQQNIMILPSLIIDTHFISNAFCSIVLLVILPIALLYILTVFELDHKLKFLLQPSTAFDFQYGYFNLDQFVDPVHSVALQIFIITKANEQHRCG